MLDDAETDNELPEGPQGVSVWELGLRRFDSAIIPAEYERAENLQDRRFAVVPGGMWEGDGWDRLNENSIRVEINKAAQGAERITDDYREHRMIVNFRAVDKGADEDTAELLNGMFRADFTRSHGPQVTDNAVDEAVLGGIGAFALTTSYVDPLDGDDDRQQIDFRMVPDADQSIFFDPDSVLQQKEDAKWAIEIFAVTPDFYRAQGWGEPTNFPQGLWKPYYDWYMPDVVKVGRYYVVEEKKERLYVLRHSTTDEEQRLWAKDLADGDLEDMQTQGWGIERTRNVPRRRIRRYLLSGNGILGRQEGVIIAGDQIPLIPVYGKRRFVDGIERTRGHVRLAKDPNRVYNTQVSKLTEIASLSPREKPIFDPEQVQGLEDTWAKGDLDRGAYHVARVLRNLDGSIAQIGPIGNIQPPQLPPVTAALLQLAAGDIDQLTNSQDGADQVQSNVSAEAMDIAATRTDERSFPYIDNIRQAFQRAGEVWLSMARDVYVEDGRDVDVQDENGGQSTDTLMKPETSEKGVFGFANNIHLGRYKVIADVTEATATRRDKTVKSLVGGAQIVAAFDPELASAMIGTAIVNMDGDGMKDLQDWERGRLVQQGIIKPTDEEKQAMEQAAANQQPDPQSQALQAQAQALAAQAGKEAALTEKAKADTALSAAKTDQAIADTEKTRTETRMAPVNALVEHVKGFMGIKAKRDQPKPGLTGQ